MGHYTKSLQHVLAELERLDLLIQVQVWRARQRHHNDEEGLPAFYIPETEVDALLEKAIGPPTWAAVPLPPDMQKSIQHRLDQMAADITQDTEESLRQGVFLRLVALAHLFGLDSFDLNVITVCLAPEIDRRYERLYAYLQDDVTRRHPTIDLVLNLLCPDVETKVAMRARFTPAAPLLQHHLLQLADDPNQRSPSLLGKTLQLDPRVARYLLDDDTLDDRLQPYTHVVFPKTALDDLFFPAAFTQRLRQVADTAHTDGADLILYFQGRYGVGKQAAAAALCRRLNLPLLVIDGGSLASMKPEEFRTLARLIDREARLQNAALYWEGFDALLADDKSAYLAVLLSILESHPGPTFLSGEITWEPTDALHGATFVRLEFPPPGYAERLQLWCAALATDETVTLHPDADLVALANIFRLRGGQIRDAAVTARHLARARVDMTPQITRDDLHAACRMQSNRKLAELAQKITPHYTWDDLVLPADQMTQLREVANQVQYQALVNDD